MNKQKEKEIKKKIQKFNIKLDIKVNKEIETENNSELLTVEISKKKNKEFYELRNFFACPEEGMLEFTFQLKKFVRPRYKSVLMNHLKNAYLSCPKEIFLIDTIQTPLDDIRKLKGFEQDLTLFVENLVKAYETLLSEKTVTFSFVRKT